MWYTELCQKSNVDFANYQSSFSVDVRHRKQEGQCNPEFVTTQC
jgi:hypothetical protein